MNLMKHLLTAIACCLAVAGSAQSDAYPFNPDSDGDGLIGVEDLLALLSDFGMPAELETCFKGDICMALTGGQCPSGVGTVFTRRPYSGVRIITLPTENYSDGDLMHIICGQEYAYGGYVLITYLDSLDTSVTIGQFYNSNDPTWTGGGINSASAIFSDGIWIWQGHGSNTVSP